MSIARLMQQAAGGVPTGGGWDLANAAYNGTPVNWFSVYPQDAGSSGLFFKSDGTKMYTIGTSTNSVHEYDLSSAWDVATASHLQSFSVSAQESFSTGLFFKPDGTKMYVVGSNGDDVNEYDLSTAWNISTASYVQNFSVATQDLNPSGLFFKTDGTEMYIVGYTGKDINQYSLSSAWDISTASYVRNQSVSSQEGFPTGVFFKDDGTKMYVIGGGTDSVYEYTLSTAWNISTVSYLGASKSVLNQTNNPQSVFFKSDGTRMYVLGGFVSQLDLSSAWSVSTASFTNPSSDYFSVVAQDISPQSIFFKPDGTQMYVVGGVGDDVNEYSLSSAWDISTASYVRNRSVTTQEASPTGVFFKPDGTKMYIVGDNGDEVNEYNLSTAWNISTTSFVQNFSVAGQETNPKGIFFKDDGTKMYIAGDAGNDINEYDLSSAWDISTASYLQNFSVSAKQTTPQDVFFKPDGTKMYVVGSQPFTAMNVDQYDLSSAWDISTSSYVQSFGVAGQQLLPTGLFFKDDGTKMYVSGSANAVIFSYDL